MLTKEFLIEYNDIRKKADIAENARRNLYNLGLLFTNINSKLEEIIKTYNKANKKVIDYIISFLPKRLIDELNTTRSYGAFVTDINTRISFHAEVTLCTDFNTIHIKFDNENKCCYYQSWMLNDETINIIKKYDIENNNQFNAWIYHESQ